MKINNIWSILFLTVIYSCSWDNEAEDGLLNIPQDIEQSTLAKQWELTKVTSSWTGTETIGDDIGYEEFYTFTADNTFTKTRIQNGQSQSFSGNYSLIVADNVETYELTYSNEDDLTNSCSYLKEYLRLITYTTIENTSWIACDGPILEYQPKASL